MPFEKSGIAAFVLVTVVGCGAVTASPPIAPDTPFEEPFAVATDWEPVELGFLDGATTMDVARVDLVEVILQQYFSLSVRPIDVDAVTVSMPPGSETAERFRVLVTIVGGVDDSIVGHQFRVWVTRQGTTLAIQNDAESRTFCRFGLQGPFGRLCAGR
jgi:hypothetical protein